MSLNIKKLVETDFLDWLIVNSVGLDRVEKRDGFWVNPLPRDDPDYAAAVQGELSFIKSISDVEDFSSLHIKGLKFSIGQDRYVCIMDFDGLDEFCDSASEFYSSLSVDFLLAVLVATKLKLPAANKIPNRLILDSVKDGALAGDFVDYLPKLRLLKVSGERAAYGKEMLFAAICCDVFGAGRGAWIADESISLLLAIPGAGHDWLYREFVNTISSKQLQDMFLNGYRLVEFFFPIQGVTKLRNSIGTEKEILVVLENCRADLGWYWQHGRSAKVAAQMAPSGGFLVPLARAGIVKSDVALPADGAEKLVDIRNSLAHQNFKLVEYDNDFMIGAIRSIFLYCAEAFSKYTELLQEAKSEQA